MLHVLAFDSHIVYSMMKSLCDFVNMSHMGYIGVNWAAGRPGDRPERQVHHGAGSHWIYIFEFMLWINSKTHLSCSFRRLEIAFPGFQFSKFFREISPDTVAQNPPAPVKVLSPPLGTKCGFQSGCSYCCNGPCL